MFIIRQQDGVIYSHYEVSREELKDGEIEVTKAQFQTISPPCREVDGQYIPCDPISAGEILPGALPIPALPPPPPTDTEIAMMEAMAEQYEAGLKRDADILAVYAATAELYEMLQGGGV